MHLTEAMICVLIMSRRRGEPVGRLPVATSCRTGRAVACRDVVSNRSGGRRRRGLKPLAGSTADLVITRPKLYQHAEESAFEACCRRAAASSRHSVRPDLGFPAFGEIACEPVCLQAPGGLENVESTDAEKHVRRMRLPNTSDRSDNRPLLLHDRGAADEEIGSDRVHRGRGLRVAGR